ncbi:hypothetical protein KQ944_10745 [Bacillus subtilis]|uniref:hypothetical protein n=1 Tax=Pseudochrobactrum asaccharolyticum TaxID=354351 RepID=UPI001F1B6EB6|nr:hypothetical protein [Pseudochrobactrum asaccharolyticum]MCF7645491.1 hypothetical protein [Pseudochrobactrum asaccharolyticum]MCF7672106.1 hypothetical protein [Bacillus subtilis]
MPLNMSRSALVKTFALTAVIAPLWAGTALAWTGDDVAKRLQALLKEQMVELTFSKAETNGSNVILHDAKAQIALPKPAPDETEEAEQDDKDNAPVNLGTITLSNISDAADDVYLIEKASFDDVKIVEDNSVFATSDIRFNNVRLTKDPKTDLIGRLQYAESFQIGAISVTVQSKPVFELKGVHFAQEPFSKEKASNYSWGIEALNIDLGEVDRIDQEKKKQRAAELEESVKEAAKAAEEAAEEAATSADATTETTEPATADAAPADKAGVTADADGNTDIATDDTDEMAEDSDLGEDLAETSGDMDMAAIRALGLEKINLTMDAKGSWSPYSGQYTVDQMTVSGKNIGTYNYKLTMGGYNLKFIKAVQDLLSSVMEEGGDNTAMQVAAVGMLQNLSISNMELRYDDANFFGKVLDYQAKKRDITREELVQEMKDQLQIGVDYFEKEPVVVDAAKAMGEYLDAPKSISFKIQPENPVTFGILTAVGMAEPKKLWSVLGVKVEANK